MKYLKKWHLILVLILGVTIFSCQKDDFLDLQDEDITENSNQLKSSENFKGAKKLKNPYSLKNMQKALENVKKNIKSKAIKVKGNSSQRLVESIEEFEIGTSHYYVKLTPQNAAEEDLITADSSMYVFDYPLDYEFTDEYLDNRIPDADSIPEYYTSVPVGTELPTVTSNILEELYIPEEDPFFDKFETEGGLEPESQLIRQGEINNHEDLLRHLLIEAFTLTDNESELLPEGDTSNASWIFGSRWHPSGTLKIWDDNAGKTTTTTKVFSHWEYYNCDTGDINDPLPYAVKTTDENNRIDINQCQRAVYTYVTNTVQGKYVPLEGAKVLMRQWFTIRKDITDENGYFRTKRVRGRARYILQWERYNFKIRNAWLNQAEKRGPKIKETAWNYNIKDGKQKFYGTIHRAAHHYYYKDIKGLRRPPKNGFWKTQLKIKAKYEENNDINANHAAWRRFLGLGCAIKVYNPQNNTQDIYGTVIHELAHASHWNMDRSDFNDTETKVKESWARGVQWELTRMTYTGYRPSYFGDYTGVIQDMIDGVSGYDQVSGYTIKQIEDAIIHQESWNAWNTNIKNKYDNATENNLDALFNHWN